MQPDPENEKLLFSAESGEARYQIHPNRNIQRQSYIFDINHKRRNKIFSVLLFLSVVTYFFTSKLLSEDDLDREREPVVISSHSPQLETLDKTTESQFKIKTIGETGLSEIDLVEVNELAENPNKNKVSTTQPILNTETTLNPLIKSNTETTSTSTSTTTDESRNVLTESTTSKSDQSSIAVPISAVEEATYTSTSTSKITTNSQTSSTSIPLIDGTLTTTTTTESAKTSTGPTTIKESQWISQSQSTSTPTPSSSSTTTTENSGSDSDNELEKSSENDVIQESEDLGQACVLPKLMPREASFLHLVDKKWPDAKCLKNYDLIFENGPNSTLLNIASPNVTSKWKDCCYRIIVRMNKINSKDPDNEEKLSTKCFPLKKNVTGIPQGHEFIAVYCTLAKALNKTETKPKMIDTFAFVPLKPEVEARVAKIEEDEHERKDQNQNLKKKLNLVVLGIDAVSHMNFQRIMPKAHKYLKEDLSALWLNGYTKIGDNTYPNILVALTSWNTTEAESRCVKNKSFDDCPFIWKNFSDRGYRTSYGEDAPWMGIFNYLKKGFRNSPTDYYLRPFTHFSENNIKNDQSGNSHNCYGPRLTLDVLLNYMKNMAASMGTSRRYFQFIWATSLTHDYLNAGKIGEPVMLSFLEWFKQQESVRNNTILVLMSDHGIRWGAFRATHQGKIEENMPFLYFVFPEWFKTKYKMAIKNLATNQERLTTPYDTYETFKDILLMENIEEDILTSRKESLNELIKGDKIPRGISLFLPVPKSRTCKTALIAEHWCICHETEKLSLESTKVKQAASYAVYSLNSLVAQFPQCAYLALSSVLSAQFVHPQNGKTFGNGDKVFELGFETSPGKGTFDATVVQNSTGAWKLSGVISRTNLYGNQSSCVDDKEMKKYCFCLK